MKFINQTIPIAFMSTVFLSLPLAIVAHALPQAPDTGTPSGKPVPGTTRPEAACPETPNKVTALVANKGKDFTVSAYPTVWVYIPYRTDQLSRIEFILLNGNERETIYQAEIQLTDKPGLIKIAIPHDPKYALQLNQNYRWRLNLDCRPDKTDDPDVTIDGWVRRIPLDTKLKAQLQSSSEPNRVYQENEIWYDAIDTLASRHFANATNPQVNQNWQQLLRTLNLSDLDQAPLAGSKLVPSSKPE